MKKLQVFSIRHSFSVPKGLKFTDLTDIDVKQAISVKRVFSPRFANILFKRQKI